MNIWKPLVLILPVIVVTTGVVYADRDEREGEGRGWFSSFRLDVAPVTDPLYQEECGACHFAYQPGLLPERSWQKMMTQLDDHFGDNAELVEAKRQQIEAYLGTNAADHANYKRSKGFARSIKADEIVLRITDTLYFKRKHDEVPARLVTGNKDVGSYSHCAACHTDAAKGSYNEHEVRIPGVGRWDD
ncbi:MAG: diheme cytochrome c [Gammaproteobacteria bacterium]|nr:diheme cytochrome c [Gammaproteobacteria bacterium]